MKVKHAKKFLKHFDALPRKIQLAALVRIELFLQNRNQALLRDHALSGNLTGKRAFSVTGDYRIIYEERAGELIFLFLDIGTHAQVYRQ